MFFPVEIKTTVAGPAGALEVVYCVPENPKAVTAVICHPHPLYGGTYHNKVVTTLHRTLFELGIKTVRFNFRGVQGSEGVYSEGVGEQDDLRAICDWAQKQWPNDTLWLAGFSFGAYVSAAVALEDSRVGLLMSVAPPVHHFSFNAFHQMQIPWIIVASQADELVPYHLVQAFIQKIAFPVYPVIFDHSSHFFHGHLIDLRGQLKKRLASFLPG